MPTTNAVKFTAKPPAKETPAGPYWAGQPLKDAFPNLKVRTPSQVRSHRLVIFGGEFCYIEGDGPEGAA